ncbi:MAG: hypothetical protein ACI4IE_07290 [Eubacterium sp.]
MKKGNVILTIVSVIVLIVSGIGAYFSYAEYQKAEDLYKSAQQCYVDADALSRPSFGVVNKSNGETQVCVPKDFSTKIVPKVEVIETNVKANGDILYILSDENATVFCNEAKDIIISEFKTECINSDMMSGIKKVGLSTNLEEITYTINYKEGDTFSALSDAYLMSLYNNQVAHYSRLVQAFNGEYEKDITTAISYTATGNSEESRTFYY